MWSIRWSPKQRQRYEISDTWTEVRKNWLKSLHGWESLAYRVKELAWKWKLHSAKMTPGEIDYWAVHSACKELQER